ALHVLHAHTTPRLRIKQLPENAAKAVARLAVATVRRLVRATHSRPRLGEEIVLRPASREDHFLAELERVFAEGQVLRDLFRQDHSFPEEEAVTGIRHDAFVQLADGIEFLLRNLDETVQWPAEPGHGL